MRPSQLGNGLSRRSLPLFLSLSFASLFLSLSLSPSLFLSLLLVALSLYERHSTLSFTVCFSSLAVHLILTFSLSHSDSEHVTTRQ